MLVEIFTVVKNGEYYLPLYINHYKTNFPGCIINIYNNNSTDNTVKLCKEAGCIIKPFPVYTEYLLQDFKNQIWKSSRADWIIVCDIDELIQVNSNELENLGPVNILKVEGFNMIDKFNLKDPKLFEYGVSNYPYNKNIIFKKSIKEINYSPGSHICKPVNPIWSLKTYKLLHYNKRYRDFNTFSSNVKNPVTITNLKKLFDKDVMNAVKVKCS